MNSEHDEISPDSERSAAAALLCGTDHNAPAERQSGCGAGAEPLAFFGRVMLDCGATYKVGDPMPDGYIARQEWADVHLKAGLKQEACSKCGLWWFPHQLSDTITRTPCIVEYRIGRKKHYQQSEKLSKTCLECAQRKPSTENLFDGAELADSQASDDSPAPPHNSVIFRDPDALSPDSPVESDKKPTG